MLMVEWKPSETRIACEIEVAYHDTSTRIHALLRGLCVFQVMSEINIFEIGVSFCFSRIGER